MLIQNLSYHCVMGTKATEDLPHPLLHSILRCLGGLWLRSLPRQWPSSPFSPLPLYSLSLLTEPTCMSEPYIFVAVLPCAAGACAATDKHCRRLVPAYRTHGTHVGHEDTDHDRSYCVVLFYPSLMRSAREKKKPSLHALPCMPPNTSRASHL
jgi:hypothetical protein